MEEDAPRMVKTPWQDEEMPFEIAAEMGTKKVITEHSTIGMIVTTDGYIVTHQKQEYTGHNISEIYSSDLLEKMAATENGRINALLDNEKCTLFVYPIMNQWYEVLVVNNAELFENVYSQLLTNILVSLIIFCLISFFYYLGYKNEQAYGKKS